MTKTIAVLGGTGNEGPGLAHRINKGLVALLKRDGFKSVADAVGADVIGAGA